MHVVVTTIWFSGTYMYIVDLFNHFIEVGRDELYVSLGKTSQVTPKVTVVKHIGNNSSMPSLVKAAETSDYS